MGRRYDEFRVCLDYGPFAYLSLYLTNEYTKQLRFDSPAGKQQRDDDVSDDDSAR